MKLAGALGRREHDAHVFVEAEEGLLLGGREALEGGKDTRRVGDLAEWRAAACRVHQTDVVEGGLY